MKLTAITVGEVLLIGALAVAPALAQSSAPEAPPPQITAPTQDTSGTPQANQSVRHHHHSHARHSHREQSATEPNVGTQPNPNPPPNSAQDSNAGAGANPATSDAPSASGNQ
jgi:hypothetical protein